MKKAPSPFELSRIYARGWNAAKAVSSEQAKGDAESLNPYTSEPERGRWRDGFQARSQ